MVTRKKSKPIAASDFAEFHIRRELGTGASIFIYDQVFITPVAAFALKCIERWAVAGTPDGEDSAGRQKFSMMPPQEIVNHAFTCAELAYAEAEKRGHTTRVPSYDKITAEAQDLENPYE